MKKILFAALLALTPTVAPAATIIVATSLAPNAFGSPSYAGYVQNAISALHDSVTFRGDPNSPTYYRAQSGVTAAQAIVTGFPSWNGLADPGSVFGPAYANELGRRMHFGVRINGDGTQFSISQLAFSATSNDAENALGFGFGAGSFGYSLDYQGVLKGMDGVLFTSDDIFVTSGDSSQLVDGLVGRGPGNSFAAYCAGCTIEQQQAAIDEVANDPNYPTLFTGMYTLGNSTGNGSFVISTAAAAVPEPASWAMMISGFGLVGGAMRSRKTSAPALA
jgi:hypothetical protein